MLIFYILSFCQAQGQGQGQGQGQKSKVKRQKSKLDPEVGSVMGWSTHPPYNFFWAENC